MSCLLNSQSISMPEFTSSKRAMHSTSEFIRVELDRLLFTIEQRIVIERMRLGSCAEDVFASVDAADRLRRRKHTVSTAPFGRRAEKSPLPIDLICDDLAKGLDAELAEGKRLGAVDIVDPQLAVFRLELIRQVP